MKELYFLDRLFTIIYPQFYTLYDSNMNELVFLDTGKKLKTDSADSSGKMVAHFFSNDKTQVEAFENHYHLFNRLSQTDMNLGIQVGKRVALNLFESLKKVFPEKKFIVYLEVKKKESVTIRFHQVWDDEPPYFSLQENQEKNLRLFEFKD